MGFTGKKPPLQMMDNGGYVDSEAKKWVIAGIGLRSPLKPIFTNPVEKDPDDQEDCCTTPTSAESRISTRLTCPPAPKKRKSSSRCHVNGVREFFHPPDLETVFIRRAEKA